MAFLGGERTGDCSEYNQQPGIVPNFMGWDGGCVQAAAASSERGASATPTAQQRRHPNRYLETGMV